MSSINQHDDVLVKVGPKGDVSGLSDNQWDEANCGEVKQILISHGAAVNSIQMLYYLNENLTLAHRHGGGDGDNFDVINFESLEHLTSVHGYYGPMEEGNAKAVIRSLTLVSNKATYGPFGREQGTQFHFNFCSSGLSFGGFHGRSDCNYLCAIGIHIKMSMVKRHFMPTPPSLPKPDTCSVSHHAAFGRTDKKMNLICPSLPKSVVGGDRWEQNYDDCI